MRTGKPILILCGQSNDSWSIDYKGQFLLGDKQLCYPLTVTDNFSRYLLAIEDSGRISGAEVKQTLTNLGFYTKPSPMFPVVKHDPWGVLLTQNL